MMKDCDVIIIGGGIGGLVCGAYLAKSGLKVLLFERHSAVGGYCSSFERDGVTYDVGAHCIGGVKNGIMRTICDELHLKELVKLHQFYIADKIRLSDDEICIKSNPDETINDLMCQFKNESKNIEKFFAFIQEKDYLKLYRSIINVKFCKLLDAFFVSKNLKRLFDAIMLSNKGLNSKNISAMSAVQLLRQYTLDPGYYPLGGMQKFSDALSDVIRAGNGTIMCSSGIRKVIVKNGRAAGVINDKNEKYYSKFVVSNADATETFKDLIDEQTIERIKVRELLPSLPCFGLYLNIDNRVIESVGKDVSSISCFNGDEIRANSKADIGNGRLVRWLIINLSSSINITSNRTGISVFTSVERLPTKFWDEMKEEFSNRIVETMKIVLPKIGFYSLSKVPATPVTFAKFTANRSGAAFGWASTVNQVKSSLFPQETSVEGLYLAGHWVTTGTGQGGIPSVANNGRSAAKLILERYK
jgi:prolycopene isomerase